VHGLYALGVHVASVVMCVFGVHMMCAN
jgi:hypothetical protein